MELTSEFEETSEGVLEEGEEDAQDGRESEEEELRTAKR